MDYNYDITLHVVINLTIVVTAKNFSGSKVVLKVYQVAMGNTVKLYAREDIVVPEKLDNFEHFVKAVEVPKKNSEVHIFVFCM